MSGPKPFFRWVGGKREMLPHLLAQMPAEYGEYFEPFTGGAALFWAARPARAQLSDANPHLVRTYVAVRDDVDAVLNELRALTLADSKEFYLAARTVDPVSLSDAAAAAWFLYLNRACFNGLWRVNKAGRFNVPYGVEGRAPREFGVRLSDGNVDNLRACSAALQGVVIGRANYADAVARAQAGDFVYFDPPYVPLTASASFTAYTADGFGDAEQVALRDTALALKARGVHVLLSNSAAPRVLELYAGFGGKFVERSGRVSCKGDGRAAVKEVLAW